MAQFYTLEEAARVLGMSADELKGKAQAREVRAFLDGGSWRFRVVDVDELARRRGLGSDAELHLSDLEVPAAGGTDEIKDLDLSEFQLGVAEPDLGAETMHFGKASAAPETTAAAEGSSEHDILLDDLSLPPNPVTGSSSVIIGVSSSHKHPSDSDVRLVPEDVKGPSDSDVRLASADSGFRRPSDSDVTLVKDDTADHGVLTPHSGSGSAIRQSPMFGSSAEVPVGHSSDSDFDLNPSSELIDALQPESGSDFELTALDASDEFEVTPSKASDSDVTAADPNASGINLSRPSDSGINLQGASPGGMGLGDSIELAPLSDDDIPTSQAKPAPPKKSMASTPPPVAKKGEKDIFDDTDFEVDVPLSDDDSDDNTMQLEAASDFELEESDSASEVFAIDEEAVDQNAATAMAPAAFADEEDEEDDGFESAVSSEMATAWSSSDSTGAASERSSPAVVLSRDAEAEWGGLWIGMLSVATLLMFLVCFISFDMARNLYEFRDGGPAHGLVQMLGGLFG